MQLQPEFFHHVTGIHAGDAAPLMARIALRLLGRPTVRSLPLECVKDIGRYSRSPAMCGLNEFFIAEFLRAAIMDDLAPWDEQETKALEIIAKRPIPQMII
jgi:hypothetical protein